MDMIFSVRHLMEKCIEQRVPLYQVFADLTKAFDTVNRSALWVILGELRCHPQFVGKLKQLHRNMKASVNVNGSLSGPILVDNGVKQRDIPAPTLFSIYLAVMFHMHFKIVTLGYTLALEPLAKSSTFVVSTPSRKLFTRLSENSRSQMMQNSLPMQKKTYS